MWEGCYTQHQWTPSLRCSGLLNCSYSRRDEESYILAKGGYTEIWSSCLALNMDIIKTLMNAAEQLGILVACKVDLYLDQDSFCHSKVRTI